MKRSRSPRYSERSDYHEGDEAEASSSSPPLKEDGFQYDVFLSFRGPDTRNLFSSYLYYALKEKGIVTFIDSEKLETGQEVGKLFECIQRSKIFVPIFSEGYANSKWCLDEIAKMVECGRLIIPVFFGVEPKDVRDQTGPFEDAFSRHENENIDKVSKWRKALTKAGKVKGYVMAHTNGDLAEHVWLIVKRILKEVNKTPLDVAKHPVGLESRIADVMKLLDVEAQDKVKMVGIYAMGGMGKTTLAKAVYNQIPTLLDFTSFDGCSFIENVRETAKQTGLVSLQEQLLHDVFNENVKVNNTSQGIGIIKQRIGSKKVLLVLDDVDDKKQLDALAGGANWFCPGSRIIITTRDKKILMAQSVRDSYELTGLEETQSLQLFSWHAFGKEEPNSKFAKLSKQVAATASGLPLALVIFGSHFFTLDKEKQWREMLEMLTKVQDKDIHKILKISYDVLDENAKRVFLDIACFFIGNGRKFATFMWEGCQFFPHLTIDVLVHKSLVNINDKTGEFEMHDQIRDMGRKIVQDESLHDVEMCNSRLWKDADETLDVLQNKREMKNIEAIRLFCKDFVSVSEEPFATMFQLRMLQLGYEVQLEGRHQHFPSKLRWLEWHPQDLDSLPDGLYLENIVVLDLSESSITQLCNPQTSARTKAFGKLKVLNLSDCRKLTSCPDFKSMPHLQELDLGGCSSMSELDPSIGHLNQLTYLSLSNSNSLKELPVEVWQLTSLEVFDLSSCSEITALPPQKHDKLENLNLNGCVKLRKCPEFTSMPHLEWLDFGGCVEMSELHPSIGCLKSLIYLELNECRSLKELPEQIWQLTALETIGGYADYSKITKGPSHFGDSDLLKQPSLGNKLKCLHLQNCKSITKCPDFTSMPHLETLYFGGCEKMSELHPSIGHLKGLICLNLSGCKSLKELPREIWQLTSLEEFYLDNCSQITAFPSQLGDSKSLEQPLLDSCSRFPTLPESMGHLKQLKWLCLSNFSSLKEVPKCIVSLDMLHELTVARCVQLKSLPQLPPSLVSLYATGCHQLEIIANVSNLNQLKKMDLDGCETLVDVPGIEKLKCLKTLGLSGCRNLCNSFWEILKESYFPDLYSFSISGSRIVREASYGQSLSFLLPTGFESGSLYLHVEQSNMDNLLGAVVWIDITAEDAQYSFSTLVNERNEYGYYVATIGSNIELVKRLRDICAAQRKTFMIIHVSIHGCILLHGEYLMGSYQWLRYFDKVGENIVRLEISWDR